MTTHPLRLTLAVLIRAALGVALGAWLAQWAWNTLEHELFGGPAAAYEHGLALMVVLSVFAVVSRHWLRRARRQLWHLNLRNRP